MRWVVCLTRIVSSGVALMFDHWEFLLLDQVGHACRAYGWLNHVLLGLVVDRLNFPHVIVV